MYDPSDLVLYTGPEDMYFGGIMRIVGECECTQCRYTPPKFPYYRIAPRGVPTLVLSHVAPTGISLLTNEEADEFEEEAWESARHTEHLRARLGLTA